MHLSLAGYHISVLESIALRWWVFFFTFSADPVNPGNYFLGFSVPCCFTGNDVMLSTENFSRCFILIEFTPALFQLVIWDFHVFEQSNILEQ